MRLTIAKRLVYCLFISALCFTVSACSDSDTNPDNNNGTDPDNRAPIISNISVNNITDNSAMISWTTDEPATGYVDYGIGSPSLTAGSGRKEALLYFASTPKYSHTEL